MNGATTWLSEALEGALGKGCPKCLRGRSDLRADPGFACDVCHGTGIPHFQALSTTEYLLSALKALVARDDIRFLQDEGPTNGDGWQSNELAEAIGEADAAIARAEGR